MAVSGSGVTLARPSSKRVAIGVYEVVGKPLGRGGMATVYRVKDVRGRDWAVKEFLPHLAADRDMSRRFRQEFELMSQLSHPNLVRVVELFEANGTLNIRMEFLDALSLKDVVKRHKRLPPLAAMAVGSRVASALAYVHSKGILHRDVKPDNILLTAQGKVKLGDFGVARHGRGTHTVAGSVVGTPAYLSPEQLGGKPDIGPTADIFSLGVVLYEMFEGKLPFPAGKKGGIVDMVQRRAQGTPRNPTQMADDQVRDMILSALAGDPCDRPPAAEYLAATLAVLDGPCPDRDLAELVARTRAEPRLDKVRRLSLVAANATLGSPAATRALQVAAGLLLAGGLSSVTVGWPLPIPVAADALSWALGLLRAVGGRWQVPL